MQHWTQRNVLMDEKVADAMNALVKEGYRVVHVIVKTPQTLLLLACKEIKK